MKSVRFWEETCANTFPAFESILYDGWLLRFAGGFSRNNNCVWPLYKGELPLEDKIRFCEGQYSARGLSCGFRLSGMTGHAAIEKIMVDKDYVRDNPNLLMVCPSVSRSEAEITEFGLHEWLEMTYHIHPVDDPNMIDRERQVLMKIPLPSRFVIVERDGKASGYGRSVLQGNILNIENLWTQPKMRGQGLGTQLIQGLLKWGADDGADLACITVNEPNTGAQRLYARLGFEYRYTYRYLIPRSEAD